MSNAQNKQPLMGVN